MMGNQFHNQNNQVPHEFRLFTTAEVAAILNVSLRTVQGWIRDGTLPHIRLGDGGRLIRIQGKDLDDFIKKGYKRS